MISGSWGGVPTESDCRGGPDQLTVSQSLIYSVLSSDVRWNVSVLFSVSRLRPDREDPDL